MQPSIRSIVLLASLAAAALPSLAAADPEPPAAPSAAPQAAPISIAYLSGSAERRAGLRWIPLDVGYQFASGSALVRVGKSSALEATRGDRRVSITASGSFDLDRLLSLPPPKEGPFARLKAFFSPGQRDDAAMGVRGAAALPPLRLSGTFSDVQAALDSSAAALDSGDLETAEESLSEAAELYSWTDKGDDALEGRIAFATASLRAAEGRLAEALEALAPERSYAALVSGDPDLALPWVILEASLALSGQDPRRALGLCEPLLSGPDAPSLSEGAAASLRGIADEARAALGKR